MNHFELMAMMIVMMMMRVMIRIVMKSKEGNSNKIIINIQWVFTLSR